MQARRDFWMRTSCPTVRRRSATACCGTSQYCHSTQRRNMRKQSLTSKTDSGQPMLCKGGPSVDHRAKFAVFSSDCCRFFFFFRAETHVLTFPELYFWKKCYVHVFLMKTDSQIPYCFRPFCLLSNCYPRPRNIRNFTWRDCVCSARDWEW